MEKNDGISVIEPSGKIQENITSMVIDRTGSMGKPTSIVFFSSPDTLYVGGEHAVSVIDVGDYHNNTKIAEIPAFNPVDIKLTVSNGMYKNQNHRIYVANQGMVGTVRQSFVSVIDPLKNRAITYIPLTHPCKGCYQTGMEVGVVYGQSPKNKIAVDYANNKVYVSALTVDYRGVGVDNFVSVIDISNHTGTVDKKAQDIVVGKDPGPIVINPHTRLVYVGNTGSGTVSVINGFTNKVAAGVIFKVNPAIHPFRTFEEINAICRNVND